jgi:WD40 repeat protein
LIDNDGSIKSAHFDAAGDRVLTVSLNKTARVWRCATGEPLTEPIIHGAIDSAQFSPDGKTVLTTSEDGTVSAWNIETGRALTEPIKLDSTPKVSYSYDGDPIYLDVRCLPEVSPDGRRIAVTLDDNLVQIIDIETNRRLGELMVHTANVYSIRFSRDGKRIVTASAGGEDTPGEARVWDAETGKALTEPMKHADWIGSADFTPDGEKIVAGTTMRSPGDGGILTSGIRLE